MTTWKNVAEMVSCCNICNLTTKHMPTFEPKALSFYTTDFSNINIFFSKIRPNFWFLVEPEP